MWRKVATAWTPSRPDTPGSWWALSVATCDTGSIVSLYNHVWLNSFVCNRMQNVSVSSSYSDCIFHVDGLLCDTKCSVEQLAQKWSLTPAPRVPVSLTHARYGRIEQVTAGELERSDSWRPVRHTQVRRQVRTAERSICYKYASLRVTKNNAYKMTWCD